MGRLIVVCALVLGFGSLSMAHEEGPCAKDRETLCAGVEHGGGAIAKCMKENKDKVSGECKAHMEKMKGHMKEMKEACHDDVEKFCADVKPGKGHMMKCMKEHKEELSASCKEEVASAKEMRKKARKGH
ncbi:cysteine rich repeat-containing protein [uncultured Bdellovibrio sp.]|uniref:cysteine rich repeat-containing protein n=1 Tax=Bdellovibrio sp. HCB-162 TaxID=3394234 RepID=UPI0025D56386|nr:cysteine rich repeat-containing protein [uncultured Bdellovibrio sp.]